MKKHSLTVWFNRFVGSLVRDLKKIATPTDLVIVARFATCHNHEQSHFMLASLDARAEIQHPELIDMRAVGEAFGVTHQRRCGMMPTVEDDTLHAFLSACKPRMVQGVMVSVAVKDWEPAPQVEEVEHSDLFIDYAKKGDEAGFKDLARMTLQLTSAEIDEMWAGTVKRLRK